MSAISAFEAEVIGRLPLASAVWVAGRQLGDLTQPARALAAGGRFLFRLNRETGFRGDPARPAEAGADPAGRTPGRGAGRASAAPARRRG